MSFYVEATNRDAYMAIKQDLLLAFIDCVERNGAKLAKQLLQVRARMPKRRTFCYAEVLLSLPLTPLVARSSPSVQVPSTQLNSRQDMDIALQAVCPPP